MATAADAQRSVAEAQRVLAKGVHITTFVEGTRSPDGRMLPFKKGPFFLAMAAGAPCIPVSIYGTETMLRKGSRASVRASPTSSSTSPSTPPPSPRAKNSCAPCASQSPRACPIDVDLEIGAGQTVALVGESGCGVSMLGRAIVGLAKPHRGSIQLEGTEARRHGQARYPSLSPLTADGISESRWFIEFAADDRQDHRRAADCAKNRDAAGTPTPRRGVARARGSEPGRYVAISDEFSGGQRQRIAIARALTLNPKLIICDEPVSALDVSVQAQVLNLLVDLQRDLGLSYLFISHDLSVVRHIAHSTVVMYLGRIVAKGDRRGFWKHPLHPYVKALLDAAPSMQKADSSDRRLPESEIPSALTPPPGCRFSTRCAFVQEQCRLVDPPLRELTPQQWVACHRVTTMPDGRVLAPWEHLVTTPATS